MHAVISHAVVQELWPVRIVWSTALHRMTWCLVSSCNARYVAASELLCRDPKFVLRRISLIAQAVRYCMRGEVSLVGPGLTSRSSSFWMEKECMLRLMCDVNFYLLDISVALILHWEMHWLLIIQWINTIAAVLMKFNRLNKAMLKWLLTASGRLVKTVRCEIVASS